MRLIVYKPIEKENPMDDYKSIFIENLEKMLKERRMSSILDAFHHIDYPTFEEELGELLELIERNTSSPKSLNKIQGRLLPLFERVEIHEAKEKSEVPLLRYYTGLVVDVKLKVRSSDLFFEIPRTTITVTYSSLNNVNHEVIRSYRRDDNLKSYLGAKTLIKTANPKEDSDICYYCMNNRSNKNCPNSSDIDCIFITAPFRDSANYCGRFELRSSLNE